MKVAILYICTGKYSIFWRKFYETCEEFFYPNASKQYLVFSDDESLIRSLQEYENVTPYFQRKAGWPYDTLLRFNSFCTVQDLLKGFDYCYFWNANAVFLKTIDESIIPFPTVEQELVLWRHTIGYEHEKPEQFNAEKNPESEAFVAPGTFCRSYGGGFLGGTSEGFIKMSIILRDRITRDLEKGIIATQHDQSHIVKYGSEIQCAEVIKDAIVSEEYIEDRDPYVIFLNKQKFGGMDMLRGMSSFYRFRQYAYNLLNKSLDVLRIKPLIKKIIGKK